MSAGDNLNKTLFHGSVVPLEVGDIIHPSTRVGHTQYAEFYKTYGTNEHGQSRGDFVYTLPDEERAWGWARPNTEIKHVPFKEQSARVYEVEPLGRVGRPEELGVPGGTQIGDEHVTEAARVKAVHYGRKGQTAQFPGINWSGMGLYAKSGGRGINWDAMDRDQEGAAIREEESSAREYQALEDARPKRPYESLHPDQGQLFSSNAYRESYISAAGRENRNMTAIVARAREPRSAGTAFDKFLLDGRTVGRG